VFAEFRFIEGIAVGGQSMGDFSFLFWPFLMTFKGPLPCITTDFLTIYIRLSVTGCF